METQPHLLRLRIAIILTILATVFSGVIYATVQHDLRMTANDPQIQVAEDITDVLGQGQDPAALAFQTPIDMAKSLDPFIIIYDDSGKVVAASGELDGKAPVIPKGTLDYAKKKGQNRLTWQPKPGVRLATIVAHYSYKDKDGYVAVGKSLREVEKRETDTLLMAAAAWVIALITIWLLTFVPLPKRTPATVETPDEKTEIK